MSRCCFPLVLAGVSMLIPSFAQDPAEPAEAGVAFYLQPGASQAVPLEKIMAKLRVSRKMVTLDFAPERSPLRISETQPTFIARLAVAPRLDRDMMMILDVVTGKRTALASIGPGGLTQPMPGKLVPLEYKKFGQSSYRIRPAAPLRPGEYLLTFGDSNLAYLFGVEPDAVASQDPPSAGAPPVPKEPDPNEERLKKLDALLAKRLIQKADYETRKEEILHPAAARPVTAEDRLKKLNDLLKKGLIAKPVYDKKRAEILSEM